MRRMASLVITGIVIFAFALIAVTPFVLQLAQSIGSTHSAALQSLRIDILQHSYSPEFALWILEHAP